MSSIIELPSEVIEHAQASASALARSNVMHDLQVEYCRDPRESRQPGMWVGPTDSGLWAVRTVCQESNGIFEDNPDQLLKVISEVTRLFFDRASYSVRVSTEYMGDGLNRERFSFVAVDKLRRSCGIQQVVREPDGLSLPPGVSMTNSSMFGVIGIMQRYKYPLGNWREM